MRMKTQALLVADDPVYRAWLADCLGDEVAVLPADANQGQDLIAEITATPGVGLLFIQFDEERARERADLVEQILGAYPDLPIVAVGDSELSDAVLAAMRAGARDYFVLNRDDENLTALVSRVLQRSSKTAVGASGGAADGKLYSVISGPSTPGVPFLAVHLALALQESDSQRRSQDVKRRVLLLDITSPGGASLIYLDTEQAYSALDSLRDVYRCDQTLIDTAFTRHEKGFYLLSLPEDSVTPPVIDADDLSRLLQTLKGYFDYIVVCADGGISLAPLSALIRAGDRSLLVTDQSILKSRQNKHLLHALRQADCPLDRTRLVIDRYQTNTGLDADRTAALLDLELMATLTGKLQAREEAMNAGEAMFENAPRDTYCRDVRDLTHQLTGQPVDAVSHGGLLGRLFK